MTSVDLKKFAQTRAAFAASKAIRSETFQTTRHPLRNHCRKRFEIIARGDENSRSILQDLRNVRYAWRFGRMQPVPPLYFDRVAVKFLVTGDTPDIRGNTEFF